MLKEKIQTLEKEAAELRILLEKYPNLREEKNRWGVGRLISPDINGKDDLEITYESSCGCCSDAFLIFHAIVRENNHIIYTDPMDLISRDSLELIKENEIREHLSSFKIHPTVQEEILKEIRLTRDKAQNEYEMGLL